MCASVPLRVFFCCRCRYAQVYGRLIFMEKDTPNPQKTIKLWQGGGKAGREIVVFTTYPRVSSMLVWLPVCVILSLVSLFSCFCPFLICPSLRCSVHLSCSFALLCRSLFKTMLCVVLLHAWSTIPIQEFYDSLVHHFVQGATSFCTKAFCSSCPWIRG